MEQVAITGYGCLSAAGADAQTNAQTILDGKRNITSDSGITNSQGVTFPAFPINDRDLTEGYSSLPEAMRCGELAYAVSLEALAHAAIQDDLLHQRRVGICIGTTAGNALNNDPFYEDYLKGTFPSIDPIINFRKANPAAYLARKLGTTGPAQTITNACSSGAVAIAQGMDWIRSGICDIVIAGGAEKLCPIICHGFASLLIADSSPCQPFGKTRNGLNLGEGAGLVILESDASLKMRDAHVYSRLISYSNRCDAYHLSAPDPKGSGLRAAFADALSSCNLTADHLAFINAHGTGTQENDAMEGLVYSDLAPKTPYFSVKGCTGHGLGASGGIEAVLTAIYLNNQEIPGTSGLNEPDPLFTNAPSPDRMSVSGSYALTSSIAFGGNCCVLILKKEDS